MATMCKVIMAKTKISRGLVLLLLPGLTVPLAILPVGAQSLGSASAATAATTSNSKGSSSAPSAGPTIVPKDLSELRIAPGDLLSIAVYDTPEFTNSYRVDQAGDLTIPLCGKVRVTGLTLTEAARQIETAFKDSQILVQPQVSVDIQQYGGQYVTVLGEVASPGRISLIAPTKLGDILAEAGGVTALAGAHIQIRHGSDETAPPEDVPYSRSHTNGAAALILVRPGDSVVVPRAGIVYVLGAVNRPGGYVMQEDGKLNVAEALALSGGTAMQASTGGLRVIRRNPDGSVLDFPLSYNGIAKGTQTPLMLQPQDIVYVPMSKVKAALSSTMGIISSISTAAIYDH